MRLSIFDFFFPLPSRLKIDMFFIMSSVNMNNNLESAWPLIDLVKQGKL